MTEKPPGAPWKTRARLPELLIRPARNHQRQHRHKHMLRNAPEAGPSLSLRRCCCVSVISHGRQLRPALAGRLPRRLACAQMSANVLVASDCNEFVSTSTSQCSGWPHKRVAASAKRCSSADEHRRSRQRPSGLLTKEVLCKDSAKVGQTPRDRLRRFCCRPFLRR